LYANPEHQAVALILGLDGLGCEPRFRRDETHRGGNGVAGIGVERDAGV
jgi:hypothetical protein